MMQYLETARMRFVEFEANDHHLIRDLDSDPEVVKYISNGIPSDEAEINRAMDIFLSYNKNYHQQFGFWKAILKDTNEFIGWFHFRPLKSDLDNTKKIELGYRLKKDFWGKGYATEGSKALIKKGFEELAVEEVWAHTMLAHTASANVMTKVGLSFSHEDIYEDWPGVDKRCVWYSLTNILKY